jgi:hypothetical protein
MAGLSPVKESDRGRRGDPKADLFTHNCIHVAPNSLHQLR